MIGHIYRINIFVAKLDIQVGKFILLKWIYFFCTSEATKVIKKY